MELTNSSAVYVGSFIFHISSDRIGSDRPLVTSPITLVTCSVGQTTFLRTLV